MDSRERVHWRFGLATAAVVVAGVAFAVWRNAAEDQRVRAAAYAGRDTDPGRAVVIGALVVTAVLVLLLAVWWRSSLRALTETPQAGASVSGELERLVALRDSGALSAEEFTVAKSRALAQESREAGVGRQQP